MRPDQSAARNDVLDLARLAAATGVIFIHCAPTTAAASQVVTFAQNVAVPFFLLSSLFLFWRETESGTAPASAFTRRWARVARPYLVWTALYFGARVALHLVHGSSLAEAARHHDLLHVLFAGGAAVQLYFLPLLLLGLVLSTALAGLRTRLWICAALVGVSVALPTITADGGSPALRLLQTYADWTLWLAGPIGLAGLLAASARRTPTGRGRGWWFIGAFVALDLGITIGVIPGGWRLHGLILAALLLRGCLELGATWSAPAPVAALARAAFGVFLVHHFIIEALELAASRLSLGFPPYSIPGLLSVGGITLTLSLASTLGISRAAAARRWLLGS
jgi:peptidoglycan/LPS O-acetylase OafA/YrhL